MKKLGIALSGGGLRGTAHIGVLESLKNEGLKCHYISGTSAGSIVAACYASGISPRSLRNIVFNLTRRDYLDYNWKGLANFVLGIFNRHLNMPEGILAGDRLQSLIHDITKGKKLNELDMPLAITATDLDEGKRVLFTNMPIEMEDGDTIVINDAYVSEAVRASSSIPVVFRPYLLNDRRLVDGGLKDMVPVRVLRVMGADYVVGVDLQAGLFENKVKHLDEIVTRSIDIVLRQTSIVDEKDLADMIIYPSVQHMGLGEIDKVKECIDIGRRAMQKNLQQLKNGLK
ncbi:MAG: patatin-like phospholipase family protein [Ignavibacteriales bacterium]